MALATSKIAASAASGSMAAATSRIASGGRNVASVSDARVENLNFASSIGVNDESILHHDDQGNLGSGGQRHGGHRDNPFSALLSRDAMAFRVESADQAQDPSASPRLFLNDVMRGIGTYETNMRITSPGMVKPGSVVNYLF